ncbi:MAG: hypothetical protein WC054_01450 [Candidatus Nanopelagicales bacterium]
MTNTEAPVADDLATDPRTRAMMRVLLSLSGPKLLSRFDVVDRRAIDQLAKQGLVDVGSLRGGSVHVMPTVAGARVRDLMFDAAANELADWL